MGHRHPSKLRNSEVSHARARWLLRAELAGCQECRTEGDREVLADLSVGGMFDSLITGFVLARVQQWRAPGRTPRYPATVYRIRSEEHTSALQSRFGIVCRLLPAKKTARKPRRAARLDRTGQAR